MKKVKKIFVMGKVYTMTETNISEIEKSVQKNIDGYVGEDKVRFKLYTLGNVAAMYFYRGVDYASLGTDPKKDIIDADAFLITGQGYDGFFMPEPLPSVPDFGYPYSMLQGDFLAAYRESAKILGAGKIKDAWLEIRPDVIILRVQMK
ncbi:hypothetical protein [uncultured Phocaeicola sp.]|uniref:hypothetical protein n=1 Tax=uncultured Phocaeicola sp. TaxID=990718 RepID=UPI002598E4EE|nr:hypothetical protein [uncultured Phocaeicola sp.]